MAFFRASNFTKMGQLKQISAYDSSNTGGTMAPKKQASQNADETNERWAERIREAIDRSGMSDTEIAANISRERPLSPRTIYNWKSSGQISQPYIDIFCRVVDCDVAWLVQGTPQSKIEYTRTIQGDTQVTHKRVPMREPEQLLELMLLEEDGDESTTLDVQALIADWVNDERVSTDVPFAWTVGGDVPGYPDFALQVISDDHAPAMPAGTICGVATDVWPGRGDLAFFLRRERTDGGFSGWTYHTGFFHSEDRRIPVNEDDWWWEHSNPSNNGSFWLNINADKKSRDDVEINFAKHQFVYVGTTVVTTLWRTPVLTQERTQINLRRANRQRQRKRIKNNE
jgi:hypothetical protein